MHSRLCKTEGQAYSKRGVQRGVLINQKERADCHGIPLEENIQGEEGKQKQTTNKTRGKYTGGRGKQKQTQTTNKTRGNYTGGRGKQTNNNYKQTDVIYATFYHQITLSSAISYYSFQQGWRSWGGQMCVCWGVGGVEKQGEG